MSENGPKMSADGRVERLQAFVPMGLSLVSAVGMVVALILGYLVGVAIFALVLIIFGSLASGVAQLRLDVRRDGLGYTAQKAERVRADADYRLEELASPPPSRGRDAA